jgi:hypothetical protein
MNLQTRSDLAVTERALGERITADVHAAASRAGARCQPHAHAVHGTRSVTTQQGSGGRIH